MCVIIIIIIEKEDKLMNNFDYDKVRYLKRQGKFQECLEMYMNFMKEHENDDMDTFDGNFYDGLSKIYILMNNWAAAATSLCAEYQIYTTSKIKSLWAKKNHTVSSPLEHANLILLEEAANLYTFLNQKTGGTIENDVKNSGFEILDYIIALCKDSNDLFFKYIVCKSNLFALGNINNFASMDLLIRNNMTCISKVFQGTATPEETKVYEMVYKEFSENLANNSLMKLVFFQELINLRKLI